MIDTRSSARSKQGRAGRKDPMIHKVHIELYNNKTHTIELTDDEMRMLRFDMSMALAFSQYDKYEIFDDLLELTEE